MNCPNGCKKNILEDGASTGELVSIIMKRKGAKLYCPECKVSVQRAKLMRRK